MFNSSRGGVRGGRDQFDWTDVVNDRKHRDNYLGHSLHSSNKRSFNNPNPNALWWTKGNTKNAQLDNKKIKDEEERLMKEELGLIPKSEEVSTHGLEKDEFDRITERGFSRDQNDVDRVAGLGFGDERRHKRVLAFLPDKSEISEKNELEPTDKSKRSQTNNSNDLPDTDNENKQKDKRDKRDKKDKHKIKKKDKSDKKHESKKRKREHLDKPKDANRHHHNGHTRKKKRDDRK